MKLKFFTLVLLAGFLVGWFLFGPRVYKYTSTTFFLWTGNKEESLFKNFWDKPNYIKEYHLFRYKFNPYISRVIDINFAEGELVLIEGLKEKLYYFVLRNSRDMVKNWLNRDSLGEWTDGGWLLNEVMKGLKKGDECFSLENRNDENSTQIMREYICAMGNSELVKSFILRTWLFEDLESVYLFRILAYGGLGNVKFKKRIEDLMFKYTSMDIKILKKVYSKSVEGFKKEISKRDVEKNPKGDEFLYYSDKFYKSFSEDYIKIYSEILKELDEVEREYYKKCN